MANKKKIEDYELKLRQLDERLKLLNERPVNSTMGMYTVTAGSTTEPEVTPGEVTRPADFTQDDSSTDTTGLFDDNGTILLEGPPITNVSPDDSYILGPMASMWYSWGNFTQIGYIRQSDRKMVNLGRITGEIQNWDKVSNFTSYGQLTLEQAVWYCNEPKYQNGYANYRAFYPGPPSNTPDQFGRYYCTIVGTPKATRNDPFPDRTPPTQGGPDDVGFPWGLFGLGSNNKDKKKRGPLGDLIDGLGDLGEYATNLLGVMTNQLGTGLPALDYSANIAKSILTNKPIEVNQVDIPQDRIDKLAKNFPVNSIGTDTLVTSEPIPYSDENFYETPSGEIKTHTPQTLQQYPNNTSIVHDFGKSMGYAGTNNPLAAAGQAQTQVVVPPDGSEPYLLYTDHAYHNLESSDPGEVPDVVKRAISDLVHSVRYSEPPKSDRYGEGSGGGIDTTTPNTGGMAGYPPNIRGDVRTQVRIPLSKMPSNVQKRVQFVRDYPSVNSENPINQTKAESYKPKRLMRKTNKVDLKEQTSREKRKRILREVKQPYVLREVKKEKYKFKKADKVRSKYGRTVNPDMMKQAEVPTSFKKMEDRMWGKYEKEQNAKASQDRKNVVLDHLGGTDHVLEYIFETGREKAQKIAYGNYGAEAPKKIVRKEQLKGDNLLFIADENGKKETILQSEINDKLDQKHTEELFSMYEKSVEPLSEKLKRRLTE